MKQLGAVLTGEWKVKAGRNSWSRCWLLLTLCATTPLCAQDANHAFVDASVVQVPQVSSYRGGTATNPSGEVIGMNSRYLTLNGKPWLPVMGEFHFSRVPEAQWEPEILKMKAAGVSIVAFYIFWIHHEEVEGQFDWSGQRDLRRFVQLCAKHGMYVMIRIGPWDHGEVRNGGLPDWLLKKTQHTRQNDPVYLSYVKLFYAQIAQQVSGLMWKDGGPIIGVQLENEYGHKGAGAGAEHILELKRMAVADGLDVPLYTVTGWDGAVVPHGETIGVYGGYPDEPWSTSLDKLAAPEVYMFRFGSRVSGGNMGAMGMSGDSRGNTEQYDYPFITAEMGGGIEDTYHRRPVIQPDDVAAMMPVMLGSGVNLYGTYMFQGGENPDGVLSTLQESQATGYPNDLPQKSYDFQAPLSEYGQEKPVLKKLKVFNYFLQSYGERLAPMAAFRPSRLPAKPGDFGVARIAVRADEKSGFLFFNNHVRGFAMPARTGFQVEVKLAHETVRIPEDPITIPSDAYGIWPINMPIEKSLLRYATAMPLTTTSDDGVKTIYFVAANGIQAEFALKLDEGTRVKTSAGATLLKRGELSMVNIGTPGMAPAFELTGKDGRLRVVVLSEGEGEESWRWVHSGHETMLFTDADFYSDGSTVVMQSTEGPKIAFETEPALKLTAVESPLQQTVKNGLSFDSASEPVADAKVSVVEVGREGQVDPVRHGPTRRGLAVGLATTPEESEFAKAAKWKITLPKDAWKGSDDLFLRVQYKGDIARLYSGDKLLDDDFANGEPWMIGLKRYRELIEKTGLTLEILPRRCDAPIYIQRDACSAGFTQAQTMELERLTLLPEYRVTLTTLH
jgi:beta-galactosidase